MMYRTELLEEITIENATVKINAKIEEMEKENMAFPLHLGVMETVSLSASASA